MLLNSDKAPFSGISSISILAIESSCDETSASVCADGKILSNYIANQTVHEKYGGVVPELASRAHMQNIVPVITAALEKAFPELQTEPQTKLQTIDAIVEDCQQYVWLSSAIAPRCIDA